MVAAVLGLGVVWAPPADGQVTSRRSSSTGPSESLARYVPASAGFFLEFNRLPAPDSDARADLRGLFDLILPKKDPARDNADSDHRADGIEGSDRGANENGDSDSEDWRTSLLRSLGLDGPGGLDALLKHQFAVAAPSWSRLADGVVIIRTKPDDKLIQETFAPDDAATIDGKGPVIVYRSRTRLSVATNSDVLVISQRHHAASIYRRIVQGMLNGRGSRLSADRAFRLHVGSLPLSRHGTLYVALQPGGGSLDKPGDRAQERTVAGRTRSKETQERSDGESSPEATPETAQTNADDSDAAVEANRKSADSGATSDLNQRDGRRGLLRFAVGVTFHLDHANFSFSGTLITTAHSPSASFDGQARLLNLPLTTLAAGAVQLDVSGLFGTLVSEAPSRTVPPQVRLLRQILDVDRFKRGLLDNLGNSAVFVWDQHLGALPEIPQLAVMVESSAPTEAVAAFSDAVQVVVDWFDLKNRSRKQRGLRLARMDYLGTAIYEVQAEFGPPDAAPGAAGGSLPIRPAFAAVGDAFVIALSSDHIRNLLDAEMGLSPTLASLPDMARMRARRRDGSFMVGLAQPMLIAQTVDHWLSDQAGVLPSLLVRHTGHGEGDAVPFRLGLGIQSVETGGAVRVVRVDPDGPSATRLRAGDLIQGVNGSLLSVEHATADLKRQVARHADRRSWTFRIVRGNRQTDVVVPNAMRVRTSDPVAALRQLGAVLGQIDFGSLRASHVDDDRLTAELTIRFRRPGDRG